MNKLTATLGGKSVSRVGLGCMGMSEFYGLSDEEASLNALVESYSIGYRHYDTADMYGAGKNEELLGKFFKKLAKADRDEILLASKVGIVRNPENKFSISVNGARDYVRAACHASLQRLGVDHIDLYYLHRRDPAVPLEETLGALGELKKEGKIGAIGLCEVSLDTLRAAHAIERISALQSEYSLWTRDIEQEILPACETMGIALVAFSPLGRGFLTAKIDESFMQQASPELDLRTKLPRFSSENIAHNRALVAELSDISSRLGCTPAQLSLAWLLHKGENLHVIPGSKTSKYLAENHAAAQLQLTSETVSLLDGLFVPGAVAGARYPQQILKQSNN